MHPQFVYKYQGIVDNRVPENDRNIQNLINSHAVFSTRKNFNDLFDSKIYFERPTVKQLESIRFRCDKEIKKQIESFVSSGKITEKGKKHFRKLDKKFNEMLDRYFFYCISSNANSNLMWSHYASSHTGFSIEFHAESMAPSKVFYQKDIPRINVAEAWAFPGGKDDPDNLGERIWSALRIKLEEWSYEDEYRFQLDDRSQRNIIRKDAKCILVPYPKEWVSSIIFGCKTAPIIKDYIYKNLPYRVPFKEAREGMSEILIVDSNIRSTV